MSDVAAIIERVRTRRPNTHELRASLERKILGFLLAHPSDWYASGVRRELFGVAVHALIVDVLDEYCEGSDLDDLELRNLVLQRVRISETDLADIRNDGQYEYNVRANVEALRTMVRQDEIATLGRELAARTAARDYEGLPELLRKITTLTDPAARHEGPATLDAVLRDWTAEGPLVHEPTGIHALDAATGGGPVYGTRWYVQGAPDAAKTALLAQIADEYAERGLTVGLIAADEEPSDIVTRFAQRRDFERIACERRTSSDLVAIRASFQGLDINLYTADWTIDRAADDIAQRAKARKTGGMLGIDSIQTVKCDEERRSMREVTIQTAIEMRTRAIRRAAIEHHLITITTSEMGRSHYAGKPADRANPMAGAKWSGAIEYAARVLLSLTVDEDNDDLIRIEVPKNKHGKALLGDRAIAIEIDRARQTLVESAALTEERNAERAEARAAASRKKVLADAGLVARIAASSPGETRTGIAARCRADAGSFSNPRFDAAWVLVEPALTKAKGQRNAWHYFLDGSQLAADVLASVDMSHRPQVAACRPPDPEPSE